MVQGNISDTNQAFANALSRADNGNRSQYFFFASGQAVGSFGQLQNEAGRFEANFDVNYTPVSAEYPSSAPASVIAQAGDTLRTIAARIFRPRPLAPSEERKHGSSQKSLADNAIANAAGDVRELERMLGLDAGYLGSAPVRVDIPNPAGYRIPTGNEFGANSNWRPGGLTWPGGLPEAVINPVSPGGYVASPASGE